TSTPGIGNLQNVHNGLRNRTIVISSPVLKVGDLKRYISSICKFSAQKEVAVTRMYVSSCQEDSKKDKVAKWERINVKTNKRLSNTILSRQVEENLVKDIRTFFNNESWYNSRGIPYKRGYIMSGSPGTGKTSIIKSISAEYNLPVFILD